MRRATLKEGKQKRHLWWKRERERRGPAAPSGKSKLYGFCKRNPKLDTSEPYKGRKYRKIEENTWIILEGGRVGRTPPLWKVRG